MDRAIEASAVLGSICVVARPTAVPVVRAASVAVPGPWLAAALVVVAPVGEGGGPLCTLGRSTLTKRGGRRPEQKESTAVWVRVALDWASRRLGWEGEREVGGK
jgi:hypothetical protein